jgi:hypothetical protein
MQWATRELIHFDRVLSAWLILRFIDPNAEFRFLAAGESPAPDTIPFGIPGVALASHDDESNTFLRIIKRYGIEDLAVSQIGTLVAAIVRYVMQDADQRDFAGQYPHARGLLLVMEGVMLLSASDHECLQHCCTLCDALYARLQAQTCIDKLTLAPSATVFEQTRAFAKAVGWQRRMKLGYSQDAFANALMQSR